MATAKNVSLLDNDPVAAQLEVLKKLGEGQPNTPSPDSPLRPLQIADISGATGSDEKEIQRSLYILEGHKLVTPIPEGDFTSKTWQITEQGLEAIKHLKPGGHPL